jgi:hypothetical protein
MARVYDYLLGGTNNYPADREQAARITDPDEGYPDLAGILRHNRQFIVRAVAWLAGGAGVPLDLMGAPVTQFIDAGAGLPTHPSVHEAALAAAHSARVAYVDNDRDVLAYLRRHTGPGVVAVGGDLRDPAAVLADKALREVIDTGQPVCVILGAVLHFLPAPAAADVVAGYMGRLPSGSAAVITVCRYEDEVLAARLAASYKAGTWYNHSADDVRAMFGPLRLVRGQVADVRCWPMLPADVQRDACTIGGLGIKP